MHWGLLLSQWMLQVRIWHPWSICYLSNSYQSHQCHGDGKEWHCCPKTVLTGIADHRYIIFIICRGVHFYFLKLKTVCSEMFVPKICGPVGKSLMVISLCIYIIYITLQYCDLIFNKYMELGNIYIEYNLGTLKNNSFFSL